MPLPRVSVVIITYNNEAYIEQCVQTALAQTYPSKEIIVVDDGSTDNTRQILEPYMDKIRYHYQDNGGVAMARQAGQNLARGEFVNHADGDDYFVDENKIARQVALLDEHPTWAIVQSHYQIVYDDGQLLFTATWAQDGEVFTLDDTFESLSWMMMPSLIRSAWINAVGGFISGYPRIEDFWVFMNILVRGGYIGVDANVSIAHRATPMMYVEKYRLGVKSLLAVCHQLVEQNYFPHWTPQQLNQFWYRYYFYSANVVIRASVDDFLDYIRTAQQYCTAPYNCQMLALHSFDNGVYQTLLDHIPFADVEQTMHHVIELSADDNIDEELLQWWRDVWWYYHRIELQHMEMSNLSRLKALHLENLNQWYDSSDRIFKLAQRALTAYFIPPSVYTLKSIDSFYADVKNINPNVSSANRVTLYLTMMTRCVFAKKWDIARLSLWCAIKASRHPSSLVRWFRFLRSSVKFVWQKVK